MDALNVFGLLQKFGYFGILTIVFLEMGVFFCFFLPGDSLLLAAGAMAAKGVFSLPSLLIGISVVAVVAYVLNYWVGRSGTRWVWSLKDRFLYKRAYLEKTRDFYDKHGSLAVVLGRFFPIIRTFVPLVAGLVKMPFPRFTVMNALGGLVWGMGVVLLGFLAGRTAPGVLDHMEWLLLGIVILSLIPFIHAGIKKLKKRRALKAGK